MGNAGGSIVGTAGLKCTIQNPEFIQLFESLLTAAEMKCDFIKNGGAGGAADLDAIQVVIQGAVVTNQSQFIPGADRHSGERRAGTVLDVGTIQL